MLDSDFSECTGPFPRPEYCLARPRDSVWYIVRQWIPRRTPDVQYEPFCSARDEDNEKTFVNLGSVFSMDTAPASVPGSPLLDAYDRLLTDPAYRPVLQSIAAKRVRRSGQQSAYLPDETDSSSSQPKPSFIDVPSTGMRLAYYEYHPRGRRRGDGSVDPGDGSRHAGSDSHTGGKVVLLLHDVGSSSAVWHDVATELSETGAYFVFALDSRGHGRSTWSSRYEVELLARDVHGFIVQRNLYSRPVCVIGLGMGGLVGIMLAGMGGRKLVGAVGALEVGVVLGEDAGARGGAAVHGQPWVGDARERVPVGATGGVGAVAGWLTNPLSGMGPRLVRMAGELAVVDTVADLARYESLNLQLQLLLEYETGDERQCSRLARALVREDGRGACTLRADPEFVLRFSQEQVRTTLKHLDMHVLFMFGEYSAMSARRDVCVLSSLCTSAASVTVEELPEQSSRFVRDEPDVATDALLEYVEYTATGSFDVPKGDMWARTPANLGLRPLDEFESLEAAQKALGPRKVPTQEVIEEALRQLRVEEGRDADDVSDDEGDASGCGVGSGSATALSHESKNYFGFVG